MDDGLNFVFMIFNLFCIYFIISFLFFVFLLKFIWYALCLAFVFDPSNLPPWASHPPPSRGGFCPPPSLSFNPRLVLWTHSHSDNAFLIVYFCETINFSITNQSAPATPWHHTNDPSTNPTLSVRLSVCRFNRNFADIDNCVFLFCRF